MLMQKNLKRQMADVSSETYSCGLYFMYERSCEIPFIYVCEL